jgi:hypothetical protein
LVHQGGDGGDADHLGLEALDLPRDDPLVLLQVAQVEECDLMTALFGHGGDGENAQSGEDGIDDGCFGGALAVAVRRVDQERSCHV